MRFYAFLLTACPFPIRSIIYTSCSSCTYTFFFVLRYFEIQIVFSHLRNTSGGRPFTLSKYLQVISALSGRACRVKVLTRTPKLFQHSQVDPVGESRTPRSSLLVSQGPKEDTYVESTPRLSLLASQGLPGQACWWVKVQRDNRDFSTLRKSLKSQGPKRGHPSRAQREHQVYGIPSHSTVTWSSAWNRIWTANWGLIAQPIEG